jgi:hypothetical protein
MRRRHQTKLQLEPLESRVMLSAVDQPSMSLSADVIVDTAIQAGGVDIDVHLASSDRMLIVQGPGNGNITIDLSALPENIRSLQISSFDSVTLSGEHTVDNLVLKNIHQVDAGHISFGTDLGGFQLGLWVSGVDRVHIDTLPAFVMLEGAQKSIGGKTLLEVGSFVDGAVVYSTLDSLGIASANPAGTLNFWSGNIRQTVLLNFQPENLANKLGFPDEQLVVVKTNDFARYFFASSTEQASLEQSHLVVRQAAITNPISLASLLNNSVIQAAFGGFVDSAASLADARNRIIDVDSSHALTPSDLLASQSESFGGNRATDAGASSGNLPATVSDQAESPTAHTLAGAAGATSDAPAGWDAPTVAKPADHSDDALAASILAALTRLADPFARTMSDLQGTLTTYADLAASHVSDQVRTDRQPALLVNARTARQTEDKEILVISV